MSAMRDSRCGSPKFRHVMLASISGVWMLAMVGVTYAHGPGDEAPDAAAATGAGPGAQDDVFVSELIGRQLAMARALMEKGKYLEAIRHLEAMRTRSRAYDRYENAILQQTLGYAYASRNDYAKAAAAFGKALSFKALPQEATLALMQNLGQLYIAIEHYDRGIAMLEDWMTRVPSTAVAPQTRVLLGNAYFRQKDYAKAAAQLRQAIAAVKRPDSSWYQLLAGVEQQWGRYAELVDVLQEAVAAYPEEKVFWQQLAAAYRQRHADKKAASVLALACRRGLCNARDQVYLAQLYLFLGIPLKSAQVLQAALKDDALGARAQPWLLLAESWQQALAFDKAETAYREAAKRSKDDGTPDYRLGHLYVQQERWQPAAEAFDRALRQGHLASPGRARLLLGVSLLYLGHRSEAAKALEAAARDSDVTAEARRWLRQARRSVRDAGASQTPRSQKAGDRSGDPHVDSSPPSPPVQGGP